MGHRFDCRGDLKTAEVCTAENITGVRWGRGQTQVDRNGCVQSYPMSFDRRFERGLFDQKSGALVR